METWLKWSAPVFCFLAALPHVSLVVGLMLVDPKIVTLSSAYGVSPTTFENLVSPFDYFFLMVSLVLVVSGFLLPFGVRFALPTALSATAGLWLYFAAVILVDWFGGLATMRHSIGFRWQMVALQSMATLCLGALGFLRYRARSKASFGSSMTDS